MINGKLTLNMTVKPYIAAVISFIVIDGLWLTIMTSRFYEPALQGLLSQNPRFAVAGLFYVLYAIGTVFLVVRSGVSCGWDTAKVMLHGGLLGGLAYGTYELTNFATIDIWPVRVVLVDIVWGTILTASVAGISYNFAEKT